MLPGPIIAALLLLSAGRALPGEGEAPPPQRDGGNPDTADLGPLSAEDQALLKDLDLVRNWELLENLDLLEPE